MKFLAVHVRAFVATFIDRRQRKTATLHSREHRFLGYLFRRSMVNESYLDMLYCRRRRCTVEFSRWIGKMFTGKHGGIPCSPRGSARSSHGSSLRGSSANPDLRRGASRQNRKFFRVQRPFVNAEVSRTRTARCCAYVHIDIYTRTKSRRKLSSTWLDLDYWIWVTRLLRRGLPRPRQPVVKILNDWCYY